MSRKHLNIFCAAAGLVLAAAMFISVGKFPDRVVSAARYVLFLSGVMSVFSLMLLVQTLLVGSSERLIWVKAPKPFFYTVVLTLVYVLSLDFIGFFPASGFYMVTLGWILGFKRPVGLIGGSLVLLGTVYLVFVRFLSVPVPTGLLGG